MHDICKAIPLGRPEPVVVPLSLIEWEKIGGAVIRAKVPGGWLVRSTSDTGGMTFVPDVNHTWGK